MAAQTYTFHRRGGANKANTIAATANPAMSERELVANTEKTDRIAVQPLPPLSCLDMLRIP